MSPLNIWFIYGCNRSVTVTLLKCSGSNRETQRERYKSRREASVTRQEQSNIGHGVIKMIPHVGIHHLAGIHVESRGEAAVKAGEMIESPSISHRGEQRYEQVAERDGGGAGHP